MHEYFLNQAIELAVENVKSGRGGPYGAVIVKENQVVSACSNRVTSMRDPTAHAEIHAIRVACEKLDDFKLNGCVLYSSCEPCPMCLGAIYWARLEKVYFACTHKEAADAGFDDSFIYEEIGLSPSKRSIAMLHLDLPDAAQPFEVWKNSAQKVLY
jgi:guanine deaminase